MAMQVEEEQLQAMLASAGSAGMPVLKPGENLDMEQLKAMQGSGPDAKEISQGMRQGWDAIKEMRADADVPKRIEIAEKCKADANSELAAGSPAKALKSYLVGIWLLMRGDPEPTRSLVAPVAVERDARISLGVGMEKKLDDECFGESNVSQVRELRTALHLNVAAAALKLNMFTLASEACQVVLKDYPEHPKALFRSAKAGEGSGDLAGSISTLVKLLKVDGQSENADARKLLQVLRARKAKEAKIYGGFFERAREDGGALYSDQSNGQNGEKPKIADLTKSAAEQDRSTMDGILSNRLSRLSATSQKELKQMSKMGVAPSEFVKAYRRFLKEELKKLAHDTIPEELSEIMGVMQGTEAKMEAVLDKVKAEVTARRRQEAAAEEAAAAKKLAEEAAERRTAEKAAAAAAEAADKKAAEERAEAERKVAEEAAAAAKKTVEDAAEREAAEKATAAAAAEAEKKAAEERESAARIAAEETAAAKKAAEEAAVREAAEKDAAEAAEAAERKAAEEREVERNVQVPSARPPQAVLQDAGMLSRLATMICRICMR